MVNLPPSPARKAPARPAAGSAGTAAAILRRRRRRHIAAGLLVLALAALAWRWGPLHARAVAATAYGARVACACRHVSGRDLGACRADFLPGMGLVMLGEDAEAHSVTARVPLLASSTATWREGQGCTPDPWDD